MVSIKYTSKRGVLLEFDADKKEILVSIDDEEKRFRLEMVPNEEWIESNIEKEVILVLRDDTLVRLRGI